MKIEITNKTTREELAQFNQARKSGKGKKKKGVGAFYGAMKGVFGDGLAYQQSIRKDWDGLPG